MHDKNDPHRQRCPRRQRTARIADRLRISFSTGAAAEELPSSAAVSLASVTVVQAVPARKRTRTQPATPQSAGKPSARKSVGTNRVQSSTLSRR